MSRMSLRSLVCRWYLEPIGDRKVPIDSNGAYGLVVQALDGGDPMGLSAVIELESLIDRIEDERVQAAAILSSYGWRPEQIGGVIRDKRTGNGLVEASLDAMHELRREDSNAG